MSYPMHLPLIIVTSRSSILSLTLHMSHARDLIGRNKGIGDWRSYVYVLDLWILQSNGDSWNDWAWDEPEIETGAKKYSSANM